MEEASYDIGREGKKRTVQTTSIIRPSRGEEENE